MRIVVVGNFLKQAFTQKGQLVWDEDLFKPEADLKRLDEFDVIINCIDQKDGDVEEIFYQNVLVARALGKYCNIQNKKFVQMSTGCLYGQLNQENKETDPIVSRCDYTLTKLAAERFCHENDLILRPGLFWGNRNEFSGEQNFVSPEVVVEATLSLIYAGQSGIFNVAYEGKTTISEIATRIDISAWQTQKLCSVMGLNKLKNFYRPPSIKETYEI